MPSTDIGNNRLSVRFGRWLLTASLFTLVLPLAYLAYKRLVILIVPMVAVIFLHSHLAALIVPRRIASSAIIPETLLILGAVLSTFWLENLFQTAFKILPFAGLCILIGVVLTSAACDKTTNLFHDSQKMLLFGFCVSSAMFFTVPYLTIEVGAQNAADAIDVRTVILGLDHVYLSSSPHNALLHLWNELGMIGLITYIALMIRACFTVIRISKSQRTGAAMLSTVAAFIIIQQLSFGVWASWWWAGVTLALTSIIFETRKKNPLSEWKCE